jgi:hypothetical protein
VKYFIYFCKGCSLRYKTFRTKEDRNKWVQAFLLENQFNEDNYIDIVGEIKIEWVSSSIPEDLE